MAADDDDADKLDRAEKILGAVPPTSLDGPRPPVQPYPIMANPKGTPGWNRDPLVSPRPIIGNPKGSIGGIRNPIARIGFVLALLGAIVFAILKLFVL